MDNLYNNCSYSCCCVGNSFYVGKAYLNMRGVIFRLGRPDRR